MPPGPLVIIFIIIMVLAPAFSDAARRSPLWKLTPHIINFVRRQQMSLLVSKI